MVRSVAQFFHSVDFGDQGFKAMATEIVEYCRPKILGQNDQPGVVASYSKKIQDASTAPAQ